MAVFKLDKYWNHLMERDISRALEPRDYLYASEIGQGFADIFLKCKAVRPTNPPNARSLRKFKMGVFLENVIKYLYDRTGILISHQERCKMSFSDLLPVSGKLDFLVGGTPNITEGKNTIISMGLEDYFPDMLNSIEKLNYETSITEIKSCSALMMDKFERTYKPSAHHAMQTLHYMLYKELPGQVVYVCRDDGRILTFNIDKDEYMEPYMRFVSGFTQYFRKNDIPPIEPLVRLNEENKWETNWNVEYSQYLTMLYGYETPKDYRDDWAPKVQRWNRVLKRMEEGKDLTADNRLALLEMEEVSTSFKTDRPQLLLKKSS